MFGLIVSGRLVQTDFVQVPNDPAKFVVNIPQADGINHVVLFLTGVTPFPQGFGAQIYFCWPDPQNQIVWHLLGHLTNDKPSAIFKISNLKKSCDPSSLAGPMNSMLFGERSQSSVHNAQIGISIEPLETILQSTPVEHTDPSTVSTFVEFTQKMLTNFVNYVTSFGGDTDHISMRIVQQWYDSFQRRLQADPNFWR